MLELRQNILQACVPGRVISRTGLTAEWWWRGRGSTSWPSWTVSWSSRDYDEIMIATGDFQHWLIVDKDELIGSSGTKYYSNQPVKIKASSEQCDPYYGE